jgi:hypothetical protein
MKSKANARLCIQLKAIDIEDGNGPILGDAQKRPFQPSHGVSLGTDYVG